MLPSRWDSQLLRKACAVCSATCSNSCNDNEKGIVEEGKQEMRQERWSSNECSSGSTSCWVNSLFASSDGSQKSRVSLVKVFSSFQHLYLDKKFEKQSKSKGSQDCYIWCKRVILCRWPVDSNAAGIAVNTVSQHCLWRTQFDASSLVTSPHYLLLHIYKTSYVVYSRVHGDTSHWDITLAWISILTLFSKQIPELFCQHNRGGSLGADIWWPEAWRVWCWSFWQQCQIMLV